MKRQPLNSPKASDGNTIASIVNADSSPLSAGTQERYYSKQVHVKLRLIEKVNILQDDTEGKRSTVSL